MKLAAGRTSPYTMTMDVEDAKSAARKMIARSSYAGALRELLRADRRDAEWYALQGEILTAMEQPESAMQSWREAVRKSPDNIEYRRGALAA